MRLAEVNVGASELGRERLKNLVEVPVFFVFESHRELVLHSRFDGSERLA